MLELILIITLVIGFKSLCNISLYICIVYTFDTASLCYSQSVIKKIAFEVDGCRYTRADGFY